MEWTDDQKAAAMAELERWRGLRHMDRRAVPGRGIDCIHLVLQPIFAAKVAPRMKLPAYNTTLGLVGEENTIAACLEQCFHAARLGTDAEPAFGDILVFKAGNQSNHCGFIAPCSVLHPAGELAVWHVMKGRNVAPTPLRPALRASQEIIRLVAPGWRVEPTEAKLAQIRANRKHR